MNEQEHAGAAHSYDSKGFQVDRTGCGEGLAALLTQRFGEELIVAFRFTRPAKRRLTEQWLAMSNSGWLKMCQVDKAPTMIAEEAWKRLRLVRYKVPAPETMTVYVEPGEGHDDFLMSIALVAKALSSFVAPKDAG